MKKTIPAFLVLFLLMALLYGRPIIVGDGITYYALAVSLLRDHDFNLTNERRQFPEVMTRLNQTTGKQAPLYSCGFGIVYAPFLAATQGLAYFAPSLAEWQPYGQNERFPFVHALGIFTGSLFFGFFTMLWAHFLLTYKFNQPGWTSFLISVLLFIGTPLIFYTFAMPSYSHAADAFLIATIFSLVFLNPTTGWRILVRNICLGLAMALSVSLRNVNIVLVLPAIGGVLFLQRRAGWKQNLTTIVQILVAALPIVIVQTRFNLAHYGTIFATGYKVQLQTSFLFEMLFHPWAGVFVWAPITIAATIGLVIGAYKRDFASILSLIAVGLVIVMISFQGNWWGGCSFGQRFLTHLYVFWAIGLFQFIVWMKRTGIVFSALFALWTFFLFHIFFVNASSIEVKKTLNENNCRRTPLEMIDWAWQDYRNSGIANPISFWLHAANSRPYPTLQFVLRHERKQPLRGR